MFQFWVKTSYRYFHLFLAALIQIQISSALRKDDVLQCFPICVKLHGNEVALEKKQKLDMTLEQFPQSSWKGSSINRHQRSSLTTDKLFFLTDFTADF